MENIDRRRLRISDWDNTSAGMDRSSTDLCCARVEVEKTDVIQIQVRDGEQIPRWYRIAWYDFARRRTICYPIGIRWIAWAVRACWNWTYKQTWPDAWELACHDVAEKAKAEVRDKWERDNAESAEFAKRAYHNDASYFALVHTLKSLLKQSSVFTMATLHQAVSLAGQLADSNAAAEPRTLRIGDSVVVKEPLTQGEIGVFYIERFVDGNAVIRRHGSLDSWAVDRSLLKHADE